MCGICGKLSLNEGRPVERSDIKKMMDALYHRGPDDDGMYISRQIGLGHRRLSIIDISSGKQPIANEDGTIWVVFNGEIYNYKELRLYLQNKGHILKTESDTEVIVHLYEEYAENLIMKLRGMFSFALWDNNKRNLLLARDRVGIKPLYYCLTDNNLIFASEVKAILTDPYVKREVNFNGIDNFLTYYYPPGDETLFKNIYKLSPGHYLTVKNGKTEIKEYWDLCFPAVRPSQDFKGSISQLKVLIKETVKDHMISDVPVGLLLSGGVDSSALLSLAVNESGQDISTFTVGFEGEGFADERPYARLAAERFGAKHYEMTISSKDFMEFLPKYIWHMEEPVCEPPAIALYYVSKLAGNYVKVLLSGEGGDEAFAGYPNYRNIVWLERLKNILGPSNMTVATILSKLSYLSAFRKLRKYTSLMKLPLEKYYYSRTSGPFNFFNLHANELYTNEFSNFVKKEQSIDNSLNFFRNTRSLDNLAKMLYIDTKTWLPDDLLIKADKMTMANSIELRVPFLDHKVLEFAASIPSNYKLKGFTTKYILKETIKDDVPKEILNRKKTGFPVPYESWLRNDLKDFVIDILMDKKTIARGYFDEKTILQIVNDNVKFGIYAKEVFSLIILELWHRVFIEAETVSLS